MVGTGWKLEETEGGWVAARVDGNPKFCLFGKTMEEAADLAKQAMEFYASRAKQKDAE
ncbi:MAG: hypothetical protein Q7T86_03350 [Hyphomicrobiaceae bacterium]|nr:hypothetical protein [Hyphomicrobiaceae bacterium]